MRQLVSLCLSVASTASYFPCSDPFIIVCAAQVGAVPLRVIVESRPMEQAARGPIDNARFGHLVAAANGPLPVFSSEKIAVPHGMRHRPCGSSTRSGRPASRFHEKAIKISNVFRQALGLPLIETEGAVLFALDHGANRVHVNNGFVTIVSHKPVANPPHPFVDFENGSPINHFIPPMGAGPFDGNIEILPVSPPYPNHRHHHPHHQLYRGESNSFATRLHASLMNLGPWEGRAVAFVLGKSLSLSVVRSVTKPST